jgi:ATP-dependent DNA helicase RecG
MAKHLDEDIFPGLVVALIHGRMKSMEKEEIMERFRNGEIDILVATTVIEVGVDVPNASLMLIEHAERFGLAQLHQLRGRVGRGERASKCLLLAQWTASDDSYKRLRVMEETTDGFKIAEEDLKIRGPGDFLGARQSGLPDFRLAEALSDMSLLKRAREEAVSFLKSDPELTSEEGKLIAKVIEARWKGRLELAEVG